MFLWFLFSGILAVARASSVWDSKQAILTQPDFEVKIQEYFPAKQQHSSQTEKNNITTKISFDEIYIPHPISNISQYSHLNITSFQIFNPQLALQDQLIVHQDTDCAASSPNALLGSRIPGITWPRLWLLDSPSAPKSFRVQSFRIKPLGYVPDRLVLAFNAYRVIDGHIVLVYGGFLMNLIPRYMPMSKLDFARYGWWPEGINALEFWAEAEGRTDWRFCVDDLEVIFEDS